MSELYTEKGVAADDDQDEEAADEDKFEFNKRLLNLLTIGLKYFIGSITYRITILNSCFLAPFLELIRL